jgi:hypothetical protein
MNAKLICQTVEVARKRQIWEATICSASVVKLQWKKSKFMEN